MQQEIEDSHDGKAVSKERNHSQCGVKTFTWERAVLDSSRCTKRLGST